MNKKFENATAMFKAVQELLEKFTATWQPSSAFSGSFEDFKVKNAAIDQLRKKTESGSKGVTNLKKISREKLIDQLYSVMVMMMACFTKLNDTVLFFKVKGTRSDLQRLRGNQLVSRAKEALALGREKLALLADYQVTESILNELETTIGLYERQLNTPRLTIGERKAANTDLDKLFRETNLILTSEIDLMMVPLEKTNPVFFNEYMNARKVVDYGIRHEKSNEGIGNVATTEPVK